MSEFPGVCLIAYEPLFFSGLHSKSVCLDFQRGLVCRVCDLESHTEVCLSLAECLAKDPVQDGLAGTSPIQVSGPDSHGYAEIADEMMCRRSRDYLRMGSERDQNTN